MLSVTIKPVKMDDIMLNVTFPFYGECHYTERLYARRHFAECHWAEGRSTL
jgi:hypothetical protein